MLNGGGGAARSVQIYGNSVTLPAGQAAYLTGPHPRIVLRGLTRALRGAELITMVLHFQNAGPVTIQAPVEARSYYYATYSPPPPPNATPPTHKPLPTVKATPSIHPSPPPPSPRATPSVKPRPSLSHRG